MSGKQYGLLVVLMAVGSLLGGCVRGNPFGRFYYDMSGGVDLTQYPSVEIAGETLLVRGTDPQKDPEKMLEDGYVYLGYSYFNAGNVNEKGAIRQGRKLGAAVVLLYSQYTNTVSGAMPMTVPDTRTSQTYGSGNIYGYGGSGFYSGSATTTSYGTRTTYVPYSVRRYDYLATYWVKTKGAIFGAYWRDLTPEERESMGSNKGVMIIAVRKGSCAFD